MTEEDKEFISQCIYFREDKEDMERYAFYDSKRLMSLNFTLWTARENYKSYKKMLDILCKDISENSF